MSMTRPKSGGFVDLDVRPRSQPKSYRDVSISAMHHSLSDKNFGMSLAWSNKNIETDKAPNPKMIHLPYNGMYGEENRSAADYESQKTIVRPRTPLNQDWGISPLFSLINSQY
jgi:hypothetical protein